MIEQARVKRPQENHEKLDLTLNLDKTINEDSFSKLVEEIEKERFVNIYRRMINSNGEIVLTKIKSLQNLELN